MIIRHSKFPFPTKFISQKEGLRKWSGKNDFYPSNSSFTSKTFKYFDSERLICVCYAFIFETFASINRIKLKVYFKGPEMMLSRKQSSIPGVETVEEWVSTGLASWNNTQLRLSIKSNPESGINVSFSFSSSQLLSALESHCIKYWHWIYR